MKTFLFFLSLCLLFFSSCEKPDDDETHHYRLWLANNTDMKISYDYRSTWYENNDQNTLKKAAESALANSQSISPKEEECLWIVGGIGAVSTWESFFKDYGSHLVPDTMMLYVFDTDRLKKTRDSTACLAQYFLSLDDLYRLNWHISYPPSEEMKDVLMWIPTR